MNKLTIREHVRQLATLLQGKRVIYVNDAKVRSAAAALEGTAELLNDSDEAMAVPVQMTVGELRHFVAYMRALDNVARSTREVEQQNTILVQREQQARVERDDLHLKVKELERELEKSKKNAQDRADVGGKRASRARLILRRAARREPRPAEGG